METQKLQKSVVPKIGMSMPAGWVLAFTAIGLLLAASIAFLVRFQEEKEQHQSWMDSYRAEARKNDDLNEKNRRLREDIDMMTSRTPPGGVSSDEAIAVYRDCLDHPVGLMFSPYLLTRPGEAYYVEFRVHNTGVLANREGEPFSLGSPCDVDPGARLKIIAVTPIDYVLGLDGQTERGITSCPAKSYHFVHDTDAVMKTAIAETCITKAKASELDPNLR